MSINFFNRTIYNKDGSMNYERASKYFGLTQSDLHFYYKGRFDLIDSVTLLSGVFVGYHPTSKNPMFYAPWDMKTCYHSSDDLKLIYGLATNHHCVPDWSTYDYFIMDANGKILFSNCEISQTIDENGIIHLKSKIGYDLDHYIYPAERKKYGYKSYYAYGRSLNDLNQHIEMLLERKVIKKPKDFKRGFSKTTETPLNSNAPFERQWLNCLFLFSTKHAENFFHKTIYKP